jgi:hypothetical protein
MAIPARDLSGVRPTVNANLSEDQTAWNLRSAFNVAALNCLADSHADIVPNYERFLELHAGELREINQALRAEFQARHGREGLARQDVYMTSVYNYFALPPVQRRFCEAVVPLTNEALTIEQGQLAGFADRALDEIEGVFDEFFTAFEEYQRDLIAWETTYGAAKGLAPDWLYAAMEAQRRVNSVLPMEGPILREGVTTADGEPAG